MQGVDPRFLPIVAAIDRVVVATAPQLEARISYRMLTYTLDRDLRNWVCAIGVTSKAVCLWFLFGAFLADERGLLRPGTSTLSTIDFKPGASVDEALIGDHVREAASRHEEFKAKALELRHVKKG